LRVPSYQTLSRFLSERPDLFQRKKQIVFALNAPYFLDATNISKLTAYYGLYSKAPQFVDMAAYLLFQELGTEGASPVSIPGISYDLSIALFPDPGQVIPLELDLPPAESTQATGTPEPTVAPVFRIGDIIPIRTGVIVDQNSHPVPDGTPVEFLFTAAGQTSPVRQVQTTMDGVARTSYTVSSQGVLEIQAVSEPAKSDIFTIEVPISSGEETSTPTETPTPTSSPTPTMTPNPIVAEILPVNLPPKPALGDWMMALLLAAGVGWLAYKYMSNVSNMRWGVRTGLLVLIGGLIAYCYLALQMPGSETLLKQSIPRGVFLVTISGAIIGLLIAWTWRIVQKSNEIK
jgi:beta-N-acetylhexosaminidase